MSREQWGNGFYAGKKSVKVQPTAWGGLLFHTNEYGVIWRQVHVKRALPVDRYLAMVISYLHGVESGGKMYKI